MPKQKKFDRNKLINKRGLGATPKELPKSTRGGGKVSTNFKLKWTRSSVSFYSAIIAIPYLTAIVLAVREGNILLLGVLLFLAILVGFLYWVIRKIDQGDDF